MLSPLDPEHNILWRCKIIAPREWIVARITNCYRLQFGLGGPPKPSIRAFGRGVECVGAPITNCYNRLLDPLTMYGESPYV